MLAEAMLSVLITQSCLIEGEIQWSHSETIAHLNASCPIRYNVQGAHLLFRSPHWFVDILIPEEPGSQVFVYRWGLDQARVGEHTVKVSYGPVDGI